VRRGDSGRIPASFALRPAARLPYAFRRPGIRCESTEPDARSANCRVPVANPVQARPHLAARGFHTSVPLRRRYLWGVYPAPPFASNHKVIAWANCGYATTRDPSAPEGAFGMTEGKGRPFGMTSGGDGAFAMTVERRLPVLSDQ